MCKRIFDYLRFLIVPFIFILNSPSAFALLGDSTKKICIGTVCTGSVLIDIGVKPQPGNADNIGAVAVRAHVTVDNEEMWTYCVNSQQSPFPSGEAGQFIQTVTAEFQPTFAICEPDGGNCGTVGVSKIIGAGLQGTGLCDNNHTWYLVDAVPKTPVVFIEEIHCHDNISGDLTACDVEPAGVDGLPDGDGLPDDNVVLEVVDTKTLDCMLNDEVFNNYEFGDVEAYNCTEF